MHDITEDKNRGEVWVAMADHFLDTETRHDLPLTALRCLEAGLSTAEARDVWRFEVTPAVGFNLLDVAGEWAGWDRDWLVGEIQRRRGRQGILWRFPWSLLGKRDLGIPGLGSTLDSIERFMKFLGASADSAKQERAARDLASLARHYFDFCPDNYADVGRDEFQRLQALYPEPFKRCMAPALFPGEAAPATGRVEAALREGAT